MGSQRGKKETVRERERRGVRIREVVLLVGEGDGAAVVLNTIAPDEALEDGVRQLNRNNRPF